MAFKLRIIFLFLNDWGKNKRRIFHDMWKLYEILIPVFIKKPHLFIYNYLWALSLCVCVCVCVCWLLSYVRLSATPWPVACQAPLSMGFFRQEYWSGLPFPSPENLPHPGIEPWSPALQADSLPFELQGSLCSFHSTTAFKCHNTRW